MENPIEEGQSRGRVWVQMRRVIQPVSYEPLELIVGESVSISATDDGGRIRKQLRTQLEKELQDFVRNEHTR